MFFEGSEKKFELVSRRGGLRARGEEFWSRVVDLAAAKILSKLSSESCDAYLLSESSLFVWDDRVTMITCGRTSLARAATFVIEQIGAKDIDLFTFERKNEYYPHQQETDFFKDVRMFHSLLPGKSYRFGTPDEHHLYLYQMDKPFKAQSTDATLEILMYNLQGPASEIFNSNQTVQRVRELTGLQNIFPQFAIDDHLFEPCGYSLNALNGSQYYTIHVTPEEFGSYVSFETNIHLGEKTASVIRSVVEVFQPLSFDLIHFHPDHELKSYEIKPFIQRSYVRQSLSCGFEVGFSTYYLRPSDAVPALLLSEDL